MESSRMIQNGQVMLDEGGISCVGLLLEQLAVSCMLCDSDTLSTLCQVTSIESQTHASHVASTCELLQRSWVQQTANHSIWDLFIKSVCSPLVCELQVWSWRRSFIVKMIIDRLSDLLRIIIVVSLESQQNGQISTQFFEKLVDDTLIEKGTSDISPLAKVGCNLLWLYSSLLVMITKPFAESVYSPSVNLKYSPWADLPLWSLID